MISIKILTQIKLRYGYPYLPHWIRVTVKDLSYLAINSVNPLFLIIDKINGYI